MFVGRRQVIAASDMEKYRLRPIVGCQSRQARLRERRRGRRRCREAQQTRRKVTIRLEIADELHGVTGEGVGKRDVRIAVFRSFLEGEPGARSGARHHGHLREKVANLKGRLTVFPTRRINILFQEHRCVDTTRPLCITQHRRHLEELVAEAAPKTDGDVQGRGGHVWSSRYPITLGAYLKLSTHNLNMSGVPLTEERFLKLIEPILTKLTHLQNFQVLESRAIEYELRKVLAKHLERKFPTMHVEPFRMKELKDPITDKVITEFDGAFGISPLRYKIDMDRVANHGLPKMSKPEKIDTRPQIFVLAEAKHLLNKNKIAIKLGQFDKIMDIFNAAKDYYITNNQSYPIKLKKMVDRDRSITNIRTFMLFFCASFWEDDLIDRLQNDINIRNSMAKKFSMAKNAQEKIEIYRKVRELEKTWYMTPDVAGQLPPDYAITDNEILQLKKIRGALEHVQFILPSGNRYNVYEELNDYEPIGTLPIGGTRRIKRGKN